MNDMKRNTFQLEYDGQSIGLAVCLGPQKRKLFDYGLASRKDDNGNYRWNALYNAQDSNGKINQRIDELEVINVHRNKENEKDGVNVSRIFLPRKKERTMSKFAYDFPMAGVTATMVLFHCLKGNDDLHIVIGKRREDSDAFPGEWCLPGGFLNAGTERVVDVARRETEEEVGVKISNDRWFHFYLDDKPGTDKRYVQVINHCFSARIDATEVAFLTPGDDITEVKVVSIDDVPELAFAHNEIVDEFVRDWEDGKEN